MAAHLESYASLPLPCTPEGNNEEGHRILETALNIFRACCPPMLEVKTVKPKIGRGYVYRCWWFVTYKNKNDAQLLTDYEIAESLQNSVPQGVLVTSINKMVIPPNWTVLYRNNTCNCCDGLKLSRSITDLNDLCSTLDSKMMIGHD